ncbi:MAG: aminotransferase class I/II-fold pyridoxal phosphate-dependent enzyme [Clostridiales bacterium]|nr:aminotransferase class I/II-fold pyridoxal phosphate-dependent enzyme [Clostridiales bacterium]
MRFNTSLLHGNRISGNQGERTIDATLPPIVQSSAFAKDSAADMEKIFHNQKPGHSYTRISNPTVAEFEQRMTVLEGGRASIACSSGMAALFNGLMGMLQSGDEIVSSASLYGGTIDLFRDLEAFGITTRYVENNHLDDFREKTNEHTRCYFAETIGNPRLDVTDIRKLAELAHENKVPLLVDNTVATAYLVRPLELGADIVINSTSKYVNGNSNSISGVITDGGRFPWDAKRYPGLKDYRKYGPFAYTAKLRNTLFRNTGACLAPQNAFYNIIGMETLGLRMERICDNAEHLARHLEKTCDFLTVNYPGLGRSPWHAVAKDQFSSRYGGILTIRAGTKENAFRMIEALQLPLQVSNIGDTKSLVIHPASTLNAHSTPKEKEEAGVFDDLVRVSVGIEDIHDLIDDFDQAVRQMMKS